MFENKVETLMLGDVMEGITMVDNDSFAAMMSVVINEPFDEIRFHNSMYSFLISSQVSEADDNDVGQSVMTLNLVVTE